jgi:hypothetical protein
MNDYMVKLVGIVDCFNYECCHECGLDADAHAFAPDPLGNPHAYCLAEQ